MARRTGVQGRYIPQPTAQQNIQQQQMQQRQQELWMHGQPGPQPQPQPQPGPQPQPNPDYRPVGFPIFPPGQGGPPPQPGPAPVPGPNPGPWGRPMPSPWPGPQPAPGPGPNIGRPPPGAQDSYARAELPSFSDFITQAYPGSPGRTNWIDDYGMTEDYYKQNYIPNLGNMPFYMPQQDPSRPGTNIPLGFRDWYGTLPNQAVLGMPSGFELNPSTEAGRRGPNDPGHTSMGGTPQAHLMNYYYQGGHPDYPRLVPQGYESQPVPPPQPQPPFQLWSDGRYGRYMDGEWENTPAPMDSSGFGRFPWQAVMHDVLPGTFYNRDNNWFDPGFHRGTEDRPPQGDPAFPYDPTPLPPGDNPWANEGWRNYQLAHNRPFQEWMTEQPGSVEHLRTLIQTGNIPEGWQDAFQPANPWTPQGQRDWRPTRSVEDAWRWAGAPVDPGFGIGPNGRPNTDYQLEDRPGLYDVVPFNAENTPGFGSVNRGAGGGMPSTWAPTYDGQGRAVDIDGRPRPPIPPHLQQQPGGGPRPGGGRPRDFGFEWDRPGGAPGQQQPGGGRPDRAQTPWAAGYPDPWYVPVRPGGGLLGETMQRLPRSPQQSWTKEDQTKYSQHRKEMTAWEKSLETAGITLNHESSIRVDGPIGPGQEGSRFIPRSYTTRDGQTFTDENMPWDQLGIRKRPQDFDWSGANARGTRYRGGGGYPDPRNMPVRPGGPSPWPGQQQPGDQTWAPGGGPITPPPDPNRRMPTREQHKAKLQELFKKHGNNREALFGELREWQDSFGRESGGTGDDWGFPGQPQPQPQPQPGPDRPQYRGGNWSDPDWGAPKESPGEGKKWYFGTGGMRSPGPGYWQAMSEEQVREFRKFNSQPGLDHRATLIDPDNPPDFLRKIREQFDSRLYPQRDPDGPPYAPDETGQGDLVDPSKPPRQPPRQGMIWQWSPWSKMWVQTQPHMRM